MNLLERTITALALDPVATMNRLQEHGIVSDNAIMPSDVADCEAAVDWLLASEHPDVIRQHG